MKDRAAEWVAGEAGRPRLSAATLDTLYERSDLRPGLYVAATAAALVTLLGLAITYPQPLVLLTAFVLIGALQHHMSIIHHEAVHHLLFRSRFINELVGTVAASMTGFTMAYRTHHLLHHRQLGSAKDPDLDAYAAYPRSLSGVIANLFWHMTGGAALVQFTRQAHRARAATKTGGATAPLQLFAIGLVQLALLAAFALIGAPQMYFLLWLLPLLTVAKTLTHIRSVVEHTLTMSDNGSPTRFRTILCGPLESFFFAPMNFNYHAEHHFYPAIPYHRLPDAFRELSGDPRYHDLVHVHRSYLGFLFGDAAAVTPPGPPEHDA